MTVFDEMKMEQLDKRLEKVEEAIIVLLARYKQIGKILERLTKLDDRADVFDDILKDLYDTIHK